MWNPCNPKPYFKNIDKNMFAFFQLTASFNTGHHALGTLTSVMLCSFSFFFFLPAKFICICFLSFTCLLALQRSLPHGPLSRLCWLRVSVDFFFGGGLVFLALFLPLLLYQLLQLFSSYLFVVYMLWSHVLIWLLVNVWSHNTYFYGAGAQTGSANL